MSATAFSTGDDVISRKIECAFSVSPTQANVLTEVYEVNRCVAWISDGGFKMVALQFPDELLVDAPKVAGQIQERISAECHVFILGDTSYGSCCVDEVGAQHYKADCIIHYGRACLSPTTFLPVLYVLGRSGIDVVDCVCRIQDLCSDWNMKIILAYDTIFSHAIDEVFSKLRPMCKHLVEAKLLVPSHTALQKEDKNKCKKTNTKSEYQADETQQSSTSLSSVIIKCGRTIELQPEECVEDYSFMFIGDSCSPTLTNLMMNFNKCCFYTYDPTSKVCQRETLNVNKALMKRYYLIERAKDANIVGIVAGTLGVVKYKDIIDHMKKLTKNAGKKSYTFVVGKLNPAKLANFAEVDVYVLVACPESSLLDQSDFYSPVVTPYEMEIACNQAREWTGDFITDFRELLPGASMYIEAVSNEEEEKTDVSLISNRIRTLGVLDSPEVCDVPSQNVVLRSEAMAVVAASENAGEFLANRSWRGLEQKLGETPITKATEGQHGIAASYQSEPT